MAYSCVRVQFEIGHEASVRNKKTQQGFTHDWELFVRGADNTDIHYFVDKVIFYLHESFHNPKRVVKEPPYVVRESGYAGFGLPIDIYFKNKEEPHKVRFRYQLTLQESGPTLFNTVREKYIFSNPSEDFRRKLIRGGGVGVGALTEAAATSNSTTGTDAQKNSVVNGSKAKLDPSSCSSSKKTKSKTISVAAKADGSGNSGALNLNDPFSSIFGQPIKTSKLQVVHKSSSSKQHQQSATVSLGVLVDANKQLGSSGSGGIIKVSSSSLSSSSSGVAKQQQQSQSGKKEKKDEDRGGGANEFNKNKAQAGSGKEKEKSEKQVQQKLSDKGKEGGSGLSKYSREKETAVVSGKNDKEQKKKRKEREEKKRTSDPVKEKQQQQTCESGVSKEEESKATGKVISTCLPSADCSVVKETAESSSKDRVANDGTATTTSHDYHSEKVKRRKERKEKKKKEREGGGEKRSRHKEKRIEEEKRTSVQLESLTAAISVPKQQHSVISKEEPAKKVKRPLNALFEELSDEKSDSSDTSSVLETEAYTLLNTPRGSEKPADPVNASSINNGPTALDLPSNVSSEETVEESLSPAGCSELKRIKKRIIAEEDRGAVEDSSYIVNGNKKKRRTGTNFSPANATTVNGSSDVGDTTVNDGSSEVGSQQLEEENQSLSSSQSSVMRLNNAGGAFSSNPNDDNNNNNNSGAYRTRMSPTYVAKLRDLQHKIMTLENNQELQRVVQIIAETGRYEITARTFDFDLCTLDAHTVRRLNEEITSL